MERLGEEEGAAARDTGDFRKREKGKRERNGEPGAEKDSARARGKAEEGQLTRKNESRNREKQAGERSMQQRERGRLEE